MDERQIIKDLEEHGRHLEQLVFSKEQPQTFYKMFGYQIIVKQDGSYVVDYSGDFL